MPATGRADRVTSSHALQSWGGERGVGDTRRGEEPETEMGRLAVLSCFDLQVVIITLFFGCHPGSVSWAKCFTPFLVYPINPEAMFLLLSLLYK